MILRFGPKHAFRRTREVFSQDLPDHFNERALWVAVITNAINDATGWPPGAARQHEAERMRREARQWLTEGSMDFIDVCCLAGIDPDALREAMLRLEAEGWHSIGLRQRQTLSERGALARAEGRRGAWIRRRVEGMQAAPIIGSCEANQRRHITGSMARRVGVRGERHSC